MKQSIHRRAFLGGLLIVASLPAVAVVVRAADRGRRTDLGERLMCMCGCGQLLIQCNHTNCPKSVPMLKELDAHIDAGETDKQILAFFTDKYGTAVNPKGGLMGQVAQVAYYLTVAVGAAVAVLVIWRWKASARDAAVKPASSGDAALDSEYHRRAEEDLKKLTPED